MSFTFMQSAAAAWRRSWRQFLAPLSPVLQAWRQEAQRWRDIAEFGAPVPLVVIEWDGDAGAWCAHSPDLPAVRTEGSHWVLLLSQVQLQVQQAMQAEGRWRLGQPVVWDLLLRRRYGQSRWD